MEWSIVIFFHAKSFLYFRIGLADMGWSSSCPRGPALLLLILLFLAPLHYLYLASQSGNMVKTFLVRYWAGLRNPFRPPNHCCCGWRFLGLAIWYIDQPGGCIEGDQIHPRHLESSLSVSLTNLERHKCLNRQPADQHQHQQQFLSEQQLPSPSSRSLASRPPSLLHQEDLVLLGGRGGHFIHLSLYCNTVLSHSSRVHYNVSQCNELGVF